MIYWSLGFRHETESSLILFRLLGLSLFLNLHHQILASQAAFMLDSGRLKVPLHHNLG